MRVRVASPALLEELLVFLRSEPDVVLEEITDDEVEVSLLGSYGSEPMRMELYLRLRAWEAARRAGEPTVEIVG
jgi:hypothetical protein